RAAARGGADGAFPGFAAAGQAVTASPTAAAAGYASGAFGARLFLIITSGYLMSYGLRAINATIAPELVDELGLSNTQLGSLTSAYFLAFACLQLPLGI